MDLTFTLGAFHATVIAERWLAGTQVMQSPVTLNNPACALGASSSLALAGGADARFFPNWTTAMASNAPLAAVTGLGPDMTSQTYVLKLMSPGEPSLSAHPKARRTRMGLLAGTQTWHLKPAVLDLPIGKLASTDGLFGAIEIEVGESLASDVESVLAASSTLAAGLRLALASGITDLDGKPAELALSFPRYAVLFDPNGDETVLHARFNEAPRWLVADGFAMEVGDRPGAPSFEVDTAAGQVTSVNCAPSLLMVAAPLAGDKAATKPLPLTVQTPLPIVTAPGAVPGWGLIAGTPPAGVPRMSLPDFSVAMIRREDLLSLEFLFFNMALEGGGGTAAKLVQKVATDQARMVVRFNAPQNIAEQAFFENGLTSETPTPPPVRNLAAGPSRLAFQLADGMTSIAYTIEALLDWAKLLPSVAPVALPEPELIEAPPAGPLPVRTASIEQTAARLGTISVDPSSVFTTIDFGVEGIINRPPLGLTPRIREPLPTETAIESPWHLFLSPDINGAWKHASQAVTLSGATELWHTRLAVRSKGHDGSTIVDETLPRKIRAIWTTGFQPSTLPGHTPQPIPPDFRKSLDPNDRYQIVRQSADFTIKNHPPKPIDAEKLFLSALGAWMDVRGTWDPVATQQISLSLEEWRHRAAMARDNYVRVVTAGFLLPHGHRASLVKVTERKFQSINGGPTTAYLRQRAFIVVREPEKSYTFLAANEQRKLPYQKLTITTLVTPDLDSPQTDPTDGYYSFIPMVNGTPYLFHLVGQDAEQQGTQTSEFTSPLYFVEFSNDVIYQHAVSNYQASGLRKRPLNGQKVAFAKSSKAGDTSFQTVDITFSAVKRPNGLLPPVFFPQMDGANVSVPAIQQVTGNSGALAIRFYQKYVDGDFGAGGVFVENAASALNVAFRGDQSGGVATPNLNVTGLSRQFGTVSGTLDNIASGIFDPTDYLSDAGAKLFGVIPLMKLIQAVFGDATVPSLKTNRLPDRIRTELHWAPHVQTFADPSGFITLEFTGDKTKSLTINTTIEALLTGGTPQATVEGHMRDFNIQLAEVIELKFKTFDFTAPAGKKLDVNVALADNDPIEFLGDLSFINELRKIIPSDGFQDPPFINVNESGVTAGYTLAVPSVGVGVFSIENIKLSAALTLPFISGPLRFRFAFSERENPFLITVSLLGGGGFFGISVGPDGVELLEASLEVGASVSIDVVVASGNVHIMVGVYLKLDFTSSSSQLTGYLRAGGSLSVLGLISASVEFYLGFTYYFGPPCSIAGEATVTIEVHVLFFSASVHPTLRREFADPQISVKDLLSPASWTTYCEAFAA